MRRNQFEKKKPEAKINDILVEIFKGDFSL